MGQYWKLVNIDRQEELLNNGGGRKLVEILGGGSLEQLVELIRNPKWIPFRSSISHLHASKSNSTGSSLLGLPQEVIDMIVSNLSSGSPESAIHLSLTCVYFFRLLGPVIQSILAEDTAPWAGDRLIFVGDYADGLNIEGFCTSEEIHQFEENEEEYNNNPLYYLAKDRVMCTMDECVKDEIDPDDDLRQAGTLEQRVRERLKRDDLQLFHRLAAIAKRTHLSANHYKNPPVLRILTAKKYVRDDAIAQSDYAYSLGEVVAVLAQWTGDASGTMDLNRVGEWAGQRFDIATIADVSEEWTDISHVAVENLRKGLTDWEKKDGKRA
ncbi:hypothetical protein N8I77_011597 [Diaporthe amygdali]|uniref:Uncharacterized protein n=1 Tax=Phomopsis amygdali TaxID=1214568 RepID=A0AAD9S740_PHOAM|nr:hypothetical protein N8I77_011597 [Diaporthe amygdali]